MYSRYEDDDDCDSVRTRGQDLRNRLRRASQAAGRIQDEAARDAVSELIEAIRLVSDVLYDLSKPPERHLTAQSHPGVPFSLS